MMDSGVNFRELRGLLTALIDGVISDEQGERLEHILREDPLARGFYRRYLQLHAMLQFDDPPLAFGKEIPCSADEFLTYVREASGQETWQKGAATELQDSFPVLSKIVTERSANTKDAGFAATGGAKSMSLEALRSSRFLMPTSIMAGLMLVSALVGGMAALYSIAEDAGVHQPIEAQRSRGTANGTQQIAGTLVNITNCRWNPGYSGADYIDGSEIYSGQTLNLLEGIAAIPVTYPYGGTGRFVLEGPLAMVVAGDSSSMLQYGKLFAAVDSKKVPYALGTPLGQVFISGSASVGVVAASQDVTVHAFAGDVDFELLWPSEVDEDRFRVSAGTSLRLSVDKSGALTIHRGEANQVCFVINVPMAQSRLAIPDDYVTAVRRARPLAYWRFESDHDGVVRNEIEDRLHLRIHGNVGWCDYVGNRAIEFGSGQNSGKLYSDDALDGAISKEFSLEAWVKPSHIHTASIVSLANWSTDGTELPRHLAMLELRGPTGPFLREQPDSLQRSPMHPRLYPERTRFLYRSPPGSDGNIGTSAYSKESYVTRQWQHLVGIHQGRELRLYLNGKLISTAEDHSEPTIEKMKILIGQLHPPVGGLPRDRRAFVGELDEVAIYGRALSDSEIKEHFALSIHKPAGMNRDSGAAVSTRFNRESIRSETDLLEHAGPQANFANLLSSTR